LQLCELISGVIKQFPNASVAPVRIRIESGQAANRMYMSRRRAPNAVCLILPTGGVKPRPTWGLAARAVRGRLPEVTHDALFVEQFERLAAAIRTNQIVATGVSSVSIARGFDVAEISLNPIFNLTYAWASGPVDRKLRRRRIRRWSEGSRIFNIV